MVNILIAIAATAFVLGVMILIHELGHHVVAKLCGVRVEVFSLGFGKRLFGFRHGDTDYRVSALPFGGYVKMSGENPLEEHSGDPGEFMSHPRWQRFLIALAGPAMNIVFAVALLTGVYMVRYDHPYYLDRTADVGYIVPDSPAAKAGIKIGDRIVRIDGVENPTWEDVRIRTMLSPRNPVSIALLRGGAITTSTITPEPRGSHDLGYTGLIPDQPNLVTALDNDLPAIKAGMRVGDEIVALNGEAVHSLPDIQNYIQQNGEKPIQVTLLRNRKLEMVTIAPAKVVIEGKTRFRLGFASDPIHSDVLPFSEALSKSIERNQKYTFLVVELVQKMAERKVSMKQIDGPIGIGRAAGEAARQEGWLPLIELMAAISLNLGVFNLLPIPILDGGLILMLLIESVIRRDINQQIKERIYQTAFVFLVLFAVLVIFNDVAKMLPNNLP